jgi:methylmalonyl-CoA mutase cobalamin-binding subunit
MNVEKIKCLLTSVPSDSHMWNLIYIQLFLQEHGYEVNNIGCCTPIDLLMQKYIEQQPELIVISTINGHGYVEGRAIIEAFKSRFGDNCPKMVIGGKLSIDPSENPQIRQHLMSLGFDEVLISDSLTPFTNFLNQLKADHQQQLSEANNDYQHSLLA